VILGKAWIGGHSKVVKDEMGQGVFHPIAQLLGGITITLADPRSALDTQARRRNRAYTVEQYHGETDQKQSAREHRHRFDTMPAS
jgi:hypothetical protein